MVKQSGAEFIVKPPLDQVKRRFKQRTKELINFSGPYKRCAIFLDKWVQMNFRTEGGKVGGWKPLSLSNPRLWVPGAAPKILQDTGRLRSSFIPFVTKANAGIGSDVSYAPIHEKGGITPEGNRVPQRRLLPKRKEIIKPISKIFDDHVKQISKRQFV